MADSDYDDGSRAYEKVRFGTPKTWKFIQKLEWAAGSEYKPGHAVIRESAGFLQVLGILMWLLTMVVYVVLLTAGELPPMGYDLVQLVVVLHVAELMAVVVDAMYYNGNSVLLQMVIIGAGLFNVFVLAAVLGSCLGAENAAGVLWATMSIGVACLANGQMAATLFAMFHTAGVMPGVVAAQRVASRAQVEVRSLLF